MKNLRNKKFEKLLVKPNPFSYSNIKKAKATLAKRNNASINSSANIDATEDSRLYTYIKFDPNAITEDLMRVIEADTVIHIMDFPFANGEIYTDEFSIDEAKAANLRDGMLYAVVPSSNATKTSIFCIPSLNAVQLDELYLPNQEDTALQFQALREIGYTEEAILSLKICLFKQAKGFVHYYDDHLQKMEPVRGMQVWGLVFGIPLHTYTDMKGRYWFPWAFSAGTIMGVHAKNSRVNIKPLNTNGTVLQVIPQLLANFITGSTHIYGWVSSCQMKNDVNFEFSGHTQVRYWSQLLNAYFFHDQYAQEDNVDNAPNGMTVYAQWANNKHFDEDGLPDFGNASTPMLNKNWSASLISQVLLHLLDFLPPVAFLRLVNAVPPDMTFRVPANTQPQFYCERLAQTAFHELGHAMHYRRAGNSYWYDVIFATLSATPIPGNPYGDGNGNNDGKIALTESWAEFIGTNHAIRRYGNNSRKAATSLFDTDPNTGRILHFNSNSRLLESEFFFFGGRWIPYGFYHDLMDDSSTPNQNPEIIWDRINGVSIQQLYNALGSDIDFMCEYFWRFNQQNPGIPFNDLMDIATNHNFNCF